MCREVNGIVSVIMDTPACSATVRIVTAVLLRRGLVLLSVTIDDPGME
jgi:hypothetical protein